MSNKHKKPYSVPKRTTSNGNVNNSRINNSSTNTSRVENKRSSVNNFKSTRRGSDNRFDSQKYKSTKNKELELTTRIRIDEERINDFETLDTSFLEGRMDRKVKNNSRVKEKILNNKKEPRKGGLKIVKIIFFLVIFVLLFILAVFLIKNNVQVEKEKKPEKVVEKSEVKTKEIDDNYLFVGDFHTLDFSFDDFDYHFVKVSEEDLSVVRLLEDLNEKIYKYNPSKVFLQLGVVDLDEGKSLDDIINKYSEVIDNILENRPYAEIYVESVYPINKDLEEYDDKILNEKIENDDIVLLNKKIEEMCKEKKINYLNLFKILSKDGKLKDDYTDNGVKLNKEAYDVIEKEIEKIVG